MEQVNITLSTGRSHGWHFGKQWRESARGKDIIAKYWRNVHRGTDSECWPWTGYIATHGYGVFGGRDARVRAHRLSWLIHYGTVPVGAVICHNCDLTSCVNPNHLRADTQASNIHESVRKGRKACWGRQKLDAEQVQAIRDRIAAGALQKDVAHEFGVSRNHVSAIVNNHVWRHLKAGVSGCASTPRHE